MQLIEVTDKKTAQAFLQVNVLVNKNDPHYIRPLDKDINDVFDKGKNKHFRFGEVIRWILKDEAGELVGRIAAYANKKYKSKGDEQPTGGIGFFDCVNDQEAADLLFNTAKNWLQERGYEAMDGPINFGERDRWWGLLVEGFEQPLYCMNYNQSYYQQLFENYGFQVFFNQFCFSRKLEGRLPERFFKGHEKVAEDKKFSARKIEKNKLDKYAQDFVTVYNGAFAGHGGNKQMDLKVAKKIFQSMKPVMDTDIVWFAYYGDVPVGIYINLPELNQIFKHLNGKFNLWAKLKFLWLKSRGVCTKFTGIIFGVTPEHQGKGVDYFLIVEAANHIQYKTKYINTELQWQGDFNPKIVNITRNLEFEQTRKLITYRYLFDRSKEFKRHPIFH